MNSQVAVSLLRYTLLIILCRTFSIALQGILQLKHCASCSCSHARAVLVHTTTNHRSEDVMAFANAAEPLLLCRLALACRLSEYRTKMLILPVHQLPNAPLL